MKNGVMSFLCVGVLCCCDVERADGEAIDGNVGRRFETTVQKAIRGDAAEAGVVADQWSATLGMGSEEERFYRAASVMIFLQSDEVRGEKEIALHAEDALRSPLCGKDAVPLVAIIFHVEEEEAESKLAAYYPTLNKDAKVAVLAMLMDLRGEGYSAEPFTLAEQTVGEAYGVLAEE